MTSFATDGKICLERIIEPAINPIKNDIISHFNIIPTCEWIKENKYLKVCLQFPDELLHMSAKIYEEIKKRVNVDLYILGDTSYASCCVDSVAAMHVKGDAIIHYGHSCFSKTNVPVFTVLNKSDLDLQIIKHKFVLNILENDTVKKCLFYDAHFEHMKDSLLEVWFEMYPEALAAVIEYEYTENRFLGRILVNKNNEILPMGVVKDYVCIYLGTRGQTLFTYTISIPALKWYLLDPEIDAILEIEETVWFKRRRYLIEKCKDANIVGILICKLSGEQTKDIIKRLKELCKINNKKSYIISVGKPNVAKLANFPEIDIYVMIGCPENDLYSSRDFYKPIVYPYELEVALNKNRDEFIGIHVTDFDELLQGRRHYCELSENVDSDMSLITGNIRQKKKNMCGSNDLSIAEKQNWALENIGHNLSSRSWKGLEQKLGETDVKKVEDGRKGIPLEYKNEPK